MIINITELFMNLVFASYDDIIHYEIQGGDNCEHFENRKYESFIW